jgi:uncharacterized Zn finger protein (UPF0148 family)
MAGQCDDCGNLYKKLRKMRDGRKICNICYEDSKKINKVKHKQEKQKKSENKTINYLKTELRKSDDENTKLATENRKLKMFIKEFYKDCSPIEQYLKWAKEIEERLK